MTTTHSQGFDNQTGKMTRSLSNGETQARGYRAFDADGLAIGDRIYDSYDAAAGACQDAAAEVNSDGAGYRVEEVWYAV